MRRRRINAHRNAMLGAFVSSTLFLISYLAYHAHAGSRPFTGLGAGTNEDRIRMLESLGDAVTATILGDRLDPDDHAELLGLWARILE
jgi:hypothetical protein